MGGSGRIEDTGGDDRAEDSNEERLKNTTSFSNQGASKRVYVRKRHVFVFIMVAFLSSLCLLQLKSLASFNQEKLWFHDAQLGSLERNDTELMELFYFSNISKSLSNSSHQTVGYHYAPHDPKVYTMARPDRTGSAILNMLVAHAWAFSHNYTFLGTCNDRGAAEPDRENFQKEMLKALGLANTLPFKCPPQNEREDNNSSKYYRLALNNFRVPGETVAVERKTPDWVNYIQSRVMYPPKEEAKPKRAVIHIRRGDVIPCLPNDALERYMPNWYFKELVERYVPKDYDIIIHSEKLSFEPWTDFTNDTSRNYQLRLSTSQLEAWQDFMTAEIVINSKSHFPVVPSILNRHGKIIHTPKHSYEPLPHWTVVDNETLARAVDWNLKQRDTAKLCRDKRFLNKVFKYRRGPPRDILLLMSRARRENLDKSKKFHI